MKKKLVTVTSVIILCLSLMTACGSSQSTTVNVGSLKGPTSMGLVSMMDSPGYSMEMFTAADELTAKLASGDIDIALIPANVASALNSKTDGNIQVIDICVLGALYIASDSSISSLSDLEGRTLYLTGKGSTPEYAIRYLLKENNIKNVSLEFKSEASEVAAILSKDSEAAGLLPQPFASLSGVPLCIDINSEWDKLDNSSMLITGVAAVNREFAEKNPEAVTAFLKAHTASTEYTNDNPEEAAEKIAELGIVPKAEAAIKAIPMCSITYIDGSEMKDALSGYLNILFSQNPKSIGGSMPDDSFYYID